jgi:anti-sigma factor RsiW
MMKPFSSHLSFERLVDLVEGHLSPAEQKPLLAHITSCARCAAEMRWLEQVIGLMRTDTSEDAPPDVIDRARRLFQPRPTPVPSDWRRIVALVNFDSQQRPLALGVRSGQPAARQLLLKAEDYDLDLRITPAGSAWQVTGQLLGPESAGEVELQGGDGLIQAELNDLGEFSLPPTPAGVYRLILRLAQVEIELPRLEIGV